MDGRELYHHRERIILISNSNSSVPLWQLPVGMPIPWNACCVMQLGGVPKHTAGCSARKKYKALPPALRSLVHDNNYHYFCTAHTSECTRMTTRERIDGEASRGLLLALVRGIQSGGGPSPIPQAASASAVPAPSSFVLNLLLLVRLQRLHVHAQQPSAARGIYYRENETLFCMRAYFLSVRVHRNTSIIMPRTCGTTEIDSARPPTPRPVYAPRPSASRTAMAATPPQLAAE